MRNFIAHSACCGRRPKGLGASRLHSRPRLLKKMMANRGIARFVVAPQGFGKTSLVCEYADAIFGFENVFWVNGQSPCFLRDLDDRLIAPSLLAASACRSLVVFEDVPYLDDERADAFSCDIDALLSRDWEVVVVLTPANDSFAERQNDRACVTACDLLVDDTEASSSGCALRGRRACDRVPALVWGGDDGPSFLLDGMRCADMPAEIQLAVFVMEVLVEGSVEDVASFVHALRKDTRRFIERHYPYVGLDLVEERFCAHEFSISAISAAFRGVIDSTVASASSSSRETLVCRLATMLARRGRMERSCELMAAFCPRRRRASWIEAEQGVFLAAGKLAVMQRLFESLGERPSGLTPGLLLGAAERLRLLGEDARAVRFALRAIGHAECTEELACRAALLIYACNQSECSSRAQAVLLDASVRRLGGDGVFSIAAEMGLYAKSDPAKAVAIAQGAPESVLSHRLLLVEMARMLRSVRASMQGADPSRLLERAYACAGRCLRSYRAAFSHGDVFEAVLCDAMGEKAWEGEAQHSARRYEVEELGVELAEQRRTWRSDSFDARRRKACCMASRPAECDKVPEMHVRLFGGMEVSIAGKTVDPSLFRKQKAKTLLAVLVLHRGKEIARQELLDIMWPALSGDRAANNLYSLWSALRRVLENDRGECPYIVRHQASYMVDARYVKSDVDEFEDLCRMLFFGQPDARAWAGAFARLQDDFSCDLLPSETGNAYIDRLRERYRARTIDAFITAADRLCEAGEPQAALWFAHAALEESGDREDAYCALMNAQMLAGQRSLAMETFLSCRKYMVEELGMDPSARMMRLHRELISGMHDGSLVSLGTDSGRAAAM